MSEMPAVERIIERLEALMKTRVQTSITVNELWLLISDVASKELWATVEGAEITNRVLFYVDTVVARLRKDGKTHLFEDSFGTFTGAMCAFLPIWKWSPSHELVKRITFCWQKNCNVSCIARWTAIKQNLTQFKLLFTILQNVGNLFIQLDLLEVLMRYFYGLNQRHSIRSLFGEIEAPDSDTSLRLMCRFFENMTGDIDTEARDFLYAFNKAIPQPLVVTLIANRAYLNKKTCSVCIPTMKNTRTNFYVDFNLNVQSVSFYTSISTFDTEDAHDADAWLPCELFCSAIRMVRCLPKHNEVAIYIVLDKPVVLYTNFKCSDALLIFDIEYFDQLKYVFDILDVNKIEFKKAAPPANKSIDTKLDESAISEMDRTIDTEKPASLTTQPPAVDVDEMCTAFESLNPSQPSHEPKHSLEHGPCSSTNVEANIRPQHTFRVPTQPTQSNSSRKSIRNTTIMRELRQRPQPSRTITPSVACRTDDVFNLEDVSDDSAPGSSAKAKSTNTKRTTSTAKPAKPKVRANARFQNPYKRHKKNAQDKFEGNHNKGVSFSYRHEKNSALGCTTKEVQIKFSGDTPPVIQSNQTTTKKAATTQAPHSKKSKTTDKPPPSVNRPLRVTKKRVSFSEVSEVVVTETPTSTTVSQTNTITEIVTNVDMDEHPHQSITQTRYSLNPSRPDVFDECRDSGGSALNRSIPSICHFDQMASDHSDYENNNHNNTIMMVPEMSFDRYPIPDSPTPPHLSINSSDTCAEPLTSIIAYAHSNSQNSLLNSPPQSTPALRSILKKPPLAEPSTNKRTASPIFAEASKRNRSSSEPGNSSSNWILQSFFERMADEPPNQSAGSDVSIDTMDHMSPIRAHRGQEAIVWDTPTDGAVEMMPDIPNQEGVVSLVLSSPTVDASPDPCRQPSTVSRVKLQSRRVSFSMDTVQSSDNSTVECSNQSLSQLIANHHTVADAVHQQSAEFVSELQAQIDRVHSTIETVLDEGVQKLDSYERKNRDFESRMERAAEEMERLRAEHLELVEEERAVRSKCFDQLSEVTDQRLNLQKLCTNEQRVREQLQRNVEELSRNVWQAAVRKTSRSLRDVLDKLDK